MCGVAEASLGLAVVGTGLTVAGQVQQGKAAKAQGDYQAAVARNNSILAERAAKDALDRGKVAEDESNRRTKQLIGRQRAVLAGNGVVVDQDSALDITADTAESGRYDALTIRSNAEREALGYRAQGANFDADAGLYGMAGSNAFSAGVGGAFGTAITGAGTVANRWYNYRKAGAFG